MQKHVLVTCLPYMVIQTHVQLKILKFLPYMVMSCHPGLRECNQDEPIEIQSVDPNSVEILVKFIYTGSNNF